MGEYTFVVEKPCPICGKATRVIKLKSRIIAEKTDEDFCVHYKGINPYYYYIWFCEHCGFAADEKHFLAPLPARNKQKIREFLSKRQLALEFTPVRGVPEAVASYKLAIYYAELIDASLAHRAGLYLHLGYRETPACVLRCAGFVCHCVTPVCARRHVARLPMLKIGRNIARTMVPIMAPRNTMRKGSISDVSVLSSASTSSS